MVFAVGHLSCAHLNRAVTPALPVAPTYPITSPWLTERLEPKRRKDVTPYSRSRTAPNEWAPVPA